MSTRRDQITIAVVMSLVLAGAALGQTAVYDNTTTDTGVVFALPGALPAGNEITLAGTDRVMTGIDVLLRLEGNGPATFESSVTFIKNDLIIGGDERPGTLLWDSGPVPLTIDSGAPVFFHFDVPDVRVPDRFSWMIRVFNQQGNMSLLGPAEFNPPTVGSAQPGVWMQVGGPALWALFSLDEAPFGARLTAVDRSDTPIPTLSEWGVLILALAFLAAGMLMIRRRRRHRGLPKARAPGRFDLRALVALLGIVACTSVAWAQVQVGPQIRIDANGQRAALHRRCRFTVGCKPVPQSRTLCFPAGR